MAEDIHASNITTHYYKIGHFNELTFSVYYLENKNDQALLELELEIRHRFPKILITYYNKCLYYFQFGHNSNRIDLSKEYDNMILKSTNKVLVETLSNPSKNTPSHSNSNSTLPEDDINSYIPFVHMGLLKATKKLVLYNLSTEGTLKLFGNYATFKEDEFSNLIVYIDPMVLNNGDLLLCVSQRTSVKLFESSILPIDLHNPHMNSDIYSNFVIYLIPSGIRCHLFDSIKVLNSFTLTQPNNKEYVLNLINLATGIDLSHDSDLIWVKLVPNLQHLNNQTSKISKFIHSIDNKKFILWPWKLCLLQFGKFEKSLHSDYNSDIIRQFNGGISEVTTNFPKDLISEFMDFNIEVKQNLNSNGHNYNNPATSNNHPSFSVPSVLSTGMGSAEHKNEMPMDMNEESMMSDLFGGIPNTIDNYFFNDNNDKTVDKMVKDIDNHDGKTSPHLSEGDVENENIENQDEMDDLFGQASDSEDSGELKDNQNNEFNHDQVQTQKDITIHDQNDEGLSSPHDVTVLDDNKQHIDDFFKLDNEGNQISDNLAHPNENIITSSSPVQKGDHSMTDYDEKEDPGNSSYIMDIPKDKMMLNFKPSKDLTPYDDPGAPLPMSATPKVPKSTTDKSRLNPKGEESDLETNRSAFSPLFFNPLIKSNIDNKYGKGGKYYVDKELRDSETDRSLRATSVTAINSHSQEEDKSTKKTKVTAPHVSTEISHNDEGEDGDFDGENEDDEDEEEEEEESDEDAVVELGKESPLKLNTHSEPFAFQNPTGIVPQTEPSSMKIQSQPIFNISTINSGGASSPIFNNLITSSTKGNMPKFDSPFAIQESPFDDRHKFTSPLAIESEDDKRNPVPAYNNTPVPSHNVPNLNSSTEKKGTPSESSNCLPLILRCINLNTIPHDFLLNNIPGAVKISASASDFNMDVDEDEDDYELSKKNEMSIKLEDLDELLNWLMPNIVFDLGLNSFKVNLIVDLPRKLEELQNDTLMDNENVSPGLKSSIERLFPLNYKVKLDEFLSELSNKNNTEVDDLNNQLSFLDDIATEEIINPKSKLKKLNLLEWDSIYVDNYKNNENFGKYVELLKDIKDSSALESNETINLMNENKIKVVKNDNDLINLNSISMRFWRYLNFKPIYGPKNLQLLLISENSQSNSNYNQNIIDSLIYNYHECNFGNMSKVELEKSDTRQDLESITGGLLLVDNTDDNYNNIYKTMSKKLNSLAELIKLDLINKTNRFEFDRPVLLLFINFNKNINSLLEISKVCRNFNRSLRRHQLPFVEVFSKVIPADYFVREINHQRESKYLSTYKLTRTSMNLYNKCPNIRLVGTNDKDPYPNLFTNIVKEPLSKINFRFFNGGKNEDSYSNDDAFLHLAYERSIDKNWVSAAWSDPLGIVTYTKSWYNSGGQLKTLGNNNVVTSNANNHNDSTTTTTTNDGSQVNRNIYDLQKITDEVFAISHKLFKKLNEELIKRTSGLGGKKFLVLTRVNNIIPDDELVHWKRLSLKYKDISLIVLSVNSSPRKLFNNDQFTDFNSSDNPQYQNNKTNTNDGSSHNALPSGSFNTENPTSNDFFKFSSVNNSNNPLPHNPGSIISPSNNFNFTNNFLSPDTLGGLINPAGNSLKNDGQSIENSNLRDLTLQDPMDYVTSVLPKSSLPSFNSPTRVGMKIGLLIKKLNLNKSNYLIYEINLLSCSNYWNLDVLMKVIMNHYKKLITLNDILGVRSVDANPDNDKNEENYSISGLVPWHVSAVAKSLDYLVHIDVEE